MPYPRQEGSHAPTPVTSARRSAREDVAVLWGYGLNPDSEGDFVKKRMADCTGEELLRETFSHLHFDDDLDA